MESVQLKRQAKAAMLPDYLPWIGRIDQRPGRQGRCSPPPWSGPLTPGLTAWHCAWPPMPCSTSCPCHQYHRSTAALLMDEFAGAYLGGQWTPIKPDASGMVPDDTHPAEHLTAVDGITQAWTPPTKPAPSSTRPRPTPCWARSRPPRTGTGRHPPGNPGRRPGAAGSGAQLDAQSGVKDMERIERKLRAGTTPGRRRRRHPLHRPRHHRCPAHASEPPPPSPQPRASANPTEHSPRAGRLAGPREGFGLRNALRPPPTTMAPTSPAP
jgi:hypothetical protein